MSHRVVVNIMHLADKITFIADQVLPKAPLPEIVLAAPVAFKGNAVPFQRTSESAFDRTPASREVAIISRQGPNRVQVIEQDRQGVDTKRPLSLDCPQGLPQAQ